MSGRWLVRRGQYRRKVHEPRQAEIVRVRLSVRVQNHLWDLDAGAGRLGLVHGAAMQPGRHALAVLHRDAEAIVRSENRIETAFASRS